MDHFASRNRKMMNTTKSSTECDSLIMVLRGTNESYRQPFGVCLSHPPPYRIKHGLYNISRHRVLSHHTKALEGPTHEASAPYASSL
jgi:hypothetical protein